MSRKKAEKIQEPDDQIARWIQRHQEYDFEIQHRKGTSHGNADDLSRRPCKESCKHCANAKKKFEIETDITVKVLKTTSVDPWSSCEIQNAQLEDPPIKLILEKKLNLADRPPWEEIAPESPATKLFWALWDSLQFKIKSFINKELYYFLILLIGLHSSTPTRRFVTFGFKNGI
ncbi:hypothetical protein AVEN_274095-1 [Araneus ventricosus]|uniref:Reverse transcriptase RNase H-like domain-containing protein n=1 Tax=Araneus ventricosus TaxID=182803 RepID=A0A4Y2SQA1_ARAVE|nr:hypothetical protein AVEN_274095-1 [Araneus ventricosus]